MAFIRTITRVLYSITSQYGSQSREFDFLHLSFPFLVMSKDVLVHVRDASHPLSYAQKADVMKVLRQLDLTPGLVESTIEVLNKSDKVLVLTVALVLRPSPLCIIVHVFKILLISNVFLPCAIHTIIIHIGEGLGTEATQTA